MGGNLFTARRLPKVEYDELTNEVVQKLSSERDMIAVPDSFKEKEDYGDLDIILPLPLIEDSTLIKLFGITKDDIDHNSSVKSFRYKDFQVDLLHFPSEELETAFAYYRQSDCMNIVGVMSRYSLGYRMTHRGLTYPVKFDHDDQIGDILVSRDIVKILEFLDLDYSEWKEGFNNPRQMFQWITRSKYFNRLCFDYSQLTHQNRTRNRKRETYRKFLEFLENEYFEAGYNNQNKQNHLFRGLYHFHYENPFWIGQAEQMVKDRVRMTKIRETFNGNHIAELTGFSGKELGQTIIDFKAYVNKSCVDGYEEFLFKNSTSYVRYFFKAWLNQR